MQARDPDPARQREPAAGYQPQGLLPGGLGPHQWQVR
jgi:hypothetical protein